MRKNYDFSKSRRNPYAQKLRKQVTMRLDEETVDYFKRMALESGIAYQVLINLYLRQVVSAGKTLTLDWKTQNHR
jgi:uncharacterized protein (DUF4415 family)